MTTAVPALALPAALTCFSAFAAEATPVAGASAALPPPAIPSPPPVARDYAPVNGLRIYYEVRGPAGGTPLVLLHGGDPAIETSWARVLPALARMRRVIAFDQQGHGRTADVDRPFTFEGSADDAAALLRHLKVAKADLMGYSNGATIAMQAAIRHPELVRRLVLVSGMVKHDGLRPEFWEGMRKAKLEDMPPHLVEAYRKTSPHPERLPSFFQKSVDRMLGFRDWPEAMVRSIAAPALVVIGDADIVLPGHATEMARLCRTPGSPSCRSPTTKRWCSPGPAGSSQWSRRSSTRRRREPGDHARWIPGSPRARPRLRPPPAGASVDSPR